MTKLFLVFKILPIMVSIDLIKNYTMQFFTIVLMKNLNKLNLENENLEK